MMDLSDYDRGFEIAFRTGFIIVFLVVFTVVIVKRVYDINTNNGG